jgi:pilus assembly protein CpaB
MDWKREEGVKKRQTFLATVKRKSSGSQNKKESSTLFKGRKYTSKRRFRLSLVSFFIIGLILTFKLLILFVEVTSKNKLVNGEVSHFSGAESIKVNTQAEFEEEVLVAVAPIEEGALLEASKFIKLKKKSIEINPRTVRDFGQIEGQYSRVSIPSGEPFFTDYVTSIKPVNAITASIPEGYRAVTIRVDDRTSVEGWVRPGVYVDVIWATRVRGKEAVAIIVEKAKVLSSLGGGEQGAKEQVMIPASVTLLTTVKDADKIQLASTSGILSLSLRGDTDLGASKFTGNLTIDDLLDGSQRNDLQKPNQGILHMKDANGRSIEYIISPSGELIPGKL